MLKTCLAGDGYPAGIGLVTPALEGLSKRKKIRPSAWLALVHFFTSLRVVCRRTFLWGCSERDHDKLQNFSRITDVL